MGKANRLRRKAKEKDRARRGQRRHSGQTARNPFSGPFSGNPQPGRPSAVEQVEQVVDEAIYATVEGDDDLVRACGTRLAEQSNPQLVDRMLRRVLEESHLDEGPDDADLVAARGDGRGQAVAGPGAEARPDVEAGGQAVEHDAGDEHDRLPGQVVLGTPTAALDRRILTIGTLSKLVWAGLRIGWVRGPREVISRLAAARSSQDVASPVLEQLLAVELMPDLDAIRESRRGLLLQRRASAVAEVRGAGWEVVSPAGGLFLWADLNGASSTRLSLAARARGVRIPPGTRYSTSGTHDRYFRVPVTCPPPSLAEAIRRITDAAPVGRARSVRTPVWTV